MVRKTLTEYSNYGARYMGEVYRKPHRKCGSSGLTPYERVEENKNRQRQLQRHYRFCKEFPGHFIFYWVEVRLTAEQAAHVHDSRYKRTASGERNSTVDRMVCAAFHSDGRAKFFGKLVAGENDRLAAKFFLVLRRPSRGYYALYLVGAIDKRKLSRLSDRFRNKIVASLVNRRWSGFVGRVAFGDAVIQCRYVVGPWLAFTNQIYIQVGEEFCFESLAGEFEIEFQESVSAEAQPKRGRPPKYILRSAKSILGPAAHSVKSPELLLRKAWQTWKYTEFDRPMDFVMRMVFPRPGFARVPHDSESSSSLKSRPVARENVEHIKEIDI